VSFSKSNITFKEKKKKNKTVVEISLNYSYMNIFSKTDISLGILCI